MMNLFIMNYLRIAYDRNVECEQRPHGDGRRSAELAYRSGRRQGGLRQKQIAGKAQQGMPALTRGNGINDDFYGTAQNCRRRALL
jgi:hypothetical protein